MKKKSKKLEQEGLDIVNDIQNKIDNNKKKKPKKFIWSSVIVVALIIWFVADRVGETIVDVVETDIDKSIYYLSDEFMEEKISNSSYSTYSKCEVTRVVDGDTIDVECPFKREETIRYAYLDTPEVWKKVNGKWQEDNQCYGKEASNINKELVEGKEVFIFDQTLIKDPYGRRISNVIVNEGRDKNLLVNSFLLGEGYATVYYSRDFVQNFLNPGKEQNAEMFESIAKKYNKGLWGKCN